MCPGVIGKQQATDTTTMYLMLMLLTPDTPMTRPNMEAFRPAIAIAPMNRPGTAQEVADCVLFLCSSKASFVQGSAMVVDGGYIIN